MRFTILEEIKWTLLKSLFYNYYSQIISNQMLVVDEWGKPEYPGENLSIHIIMTPSAGIEPGWHLWKAPLGQPCHQSL